MDTGAGAITSHSYKWLDYIESVSFSRHCQGRLCIYLSTN